MAEIAERVEDNPKTAFEKSDWPLGTSAWYCSGP